MYSLALEFEYKAFYMTVQEWVNENLKVHMTVMYKVCCHGAHGETRGHSSYLCLCSRDWIHGTRLYRKHFYPWAILPTPPKLLYYKHHRWCWGLFEGSIVLQWSFFLPSVSSCWWVSPGKLAVLPRAQYQVFESKNVQEEIYTSSHGFGITCLWWKSTCIQMSLVMRKLSKFILLAYIGLSNYF